MTIEYSLDDFRSARDCLVEAVSHIRGYFDRPKNR
jgi:hypothetical protein